MPFSSIRRFVHEKINEHIRGIPRKLVEEGVKSPDKRIKLKSTNQDLMRAFSSFLGEKNSKKIF
jgi:hypothetical protein